MQQPSPNPVTNPYGGGHTGTDYAWTRNGGTIVDKDIYSIDDGTITKIYYDKAYGNVMEIDHGSNVTGVYCHAAGYNNTLKVGDRVHQGQNIGVMGDTGTLAKARHLHLTLRVNGKNTDPYAYINNHLTTAGNGGTPIAPEPERTKTMTTMFVKGSTATANAGPGTLWAMAGDAGTPCPANWFEFTRSYTSSTDPYDKGRLLSAAHGAAIYLTDAEWAERKTAYTTIVGGGSGGSSLTTEQNDHLMSIATSAQLGVALTGTVNFVNEHADENKDEIIDAINSSSNLSGTYNITPAE